MSRLQIRNKISFSSCAQGNQILRTQNSSDPRHFGTIVVGPNCPDTSAPVPKCPKDSSDLSAKLSHPMV